MSMMGGDNDERQRRHERTGDRDYDLHELGNEQIRSYRH